jgi:hypothetical protein
MGHGSDCSEWNRSALTDEVAGASRFALTGTQDDVGEPVSDPTAER